MIAIKRQRSSRHAKSVKLSPRTLACALALLSVFGCGDDGGSGEQAPDAGAACGAHTSSGSDEHGCVCETGYAGNTCEICAPGFVQNGATCVRADEEAGAPTCDEASCGTHGRCSADLADCVCEDGYAGAGCEQCAAGSHVQDDECVADAFCEDDSCPAHAVCDDTSGVVSCSCDEGYRGDDCGDCAAGYHQGEASCVPDEGCLDTTCAGAGTCTDAAAGPVCECAEGYAGPRCDECAEAYVADDDVCVAAEACEASTCNGHGACTDTSGIVACSCTAGYLGPNCEQCADGSEPSADGSCPVGCGEGSACEPRCDAGQLVLLADGGFDCRSAVCPPGFAGADCDECSVGYHADDGSCVQDVMCSAESCFGRGECDASSGAIVCTCAPGFLGDNCAICDSGLHPESDGCGTAVVCEPDSCSGHGSCDAGSGAIVCTCDDGYAGELCQECASDHVLEQEACVLVDLGDTCENDTCSGHGSCDDSSGAALCTCSGGHTGVACQACDVGLIAHPDGSCAESTCGDGLVDPNLLEECDDGNVITELCTYYSSFKSCETCTSACVLGDGVARWCGDGVVQANKGETCDDRHNNGAYASSEENAHCGATCTGVGPYCGDGVVDEGETCDDADCSADCLTLPDTCAQPYTLTQSTNPTTITALNSVSCNSAEGHTDNSYARFFSLDDLDIGSYEVTQVRVGIESAAASGATAPASVRIYRSVGDPNNPANLTQLANADVGVPVIAPGTGEFITVPISATVEGGAGVFLVAEFFTPNGESVGNHIFIGSNAADETGSSYLRAADCGITTWWATTAFGFPDLHMLIHVDGFKSGEVCIEGDAGVDAGTDPGSSGADAAADAAPPI